MPKPLTEDTIIGDVAYEWEVNEYEQYKRGPWWHVIMILMALSLIVYGMFSGNFLLSLLIILAAIIFFMQSYQEPQKLSVAITNLGFVVGSKFFPYDELDEFYLIYKPPSVKKLFIKQKSPWRPMLRIPLLQENPIEIRALLKDYLNEDLETEDEPFTDTLSRTWRLN